MTEKQVKAIVTGFLTTFFVSGVAIIMLGYGDAPGHVKLASWGFVPPAIGIVGAMLTAVVVAGEDPEHGAGR